VTDTDADADTDADTDAECRVRRILTEDFGVAPHRIEPDALLHELSLHSVAVAELCLLAEELWGLDLDKAAITPRDSVGTLVEVIGANAARDFTRGRAVRHDEPTRWARWVRRLRRVRDAVVGRVGWHRDRTRPTGPEGT
jgi:acyl carrier protein